MKLYSQRSYSKHGRLRSVSYTQVSDIAVEGTSPDGGTVVALFDPKYKLNAAAGGGGEVPVDRYGGGLGAPE